MILTLLLFSIILLFIFIKWEKWIVKYIKCPKCNSRLIFKIERSFPFSYKQDIFYCKRCNKHFKSDYLKGYRYSLVVSLLSLLIPFSWIIASIITGDIITEYLLIIAVGTFLFIIPAMGLVFPFLSKKLSKKHPIIYSILSFIIIFILIILFIRLMFLFTTG